MNIKEKRNDKTSYIARSLSKGTKKKYETMVVNSIYARLNDENIEIATQQYIDTKDGRKFIDLYFPQFKIAVEVDEGYHNDPWQQERDKKRESAINLAMLGQNILDDPLEIDFDNRVKIVEKNGKVVSLKSLNKRIDEIVKKIQDKKRKWETENNKALVWIYDNDKKLDEIIKRGVLVRGESCLYMKDILHLFGKEVRSFMKCYYKGIWSPTLSVDGSNRNGWVNTVSDDLKEIYEIQIADSDKKEVKTKENTKKDILNKCKRYVFLKYKNVLGENSRKFLGVYQADRWDENKKAEVWKLVDDKIYLFKVDR